MKISRGHREFGLARARFKHTYQLLRVAVGQRFEQHPIHDAEDGRVRPDAQREREHSHDGEAGVLQQYADSVTKILNESLHVQSDC